MYRETEAVTRTVRSTQVGQNQARNALRRWIDFWYQNYSKPKLRATTRAGYENRIYLHIIPELGDIPLNQLTQNDLQQFYARLKKNGRLLHAEHYSESLSDTMVRGCHANCRSALEKAVQEGLIRVNPASL